MEDISIVNKAIALEWLLAIFITDRLSHEGMGEFLDATGNLSS